MQTRVRERVRAHSFVFLSALSAAGLCHVIRVDMEAGRAGCTRVTLSATRVSVPTVEL